MRSRTFAVLAILLALAVAATVMGCSEKLPEPTVDNTNAVAPKSVEPTLGLETTITVNQLAQKLQGMGLTAAKAPTKRSGLFLPAKYVPMTVDGAFLQTYRFKSSHEAYSAGRTVEADGYVLGTTPTQLINVNWTGWPAFFRSGDLIVIFVTEKGKGNAVRDQKVYDALKVVFGPPFIGGNTRPASLSSSGTPEATATLPSGH